jgi:transposase
MRFVEPKNQDQLDMQTLHRPRDELVGERDSSSSRSRAWSTRRSIMSLPRGAAS